MKLSEMKQILVSGRIRLTKSLGQNFLHDGNQLRRMVASAELTQSDRVLEVGPGLGPLTELLLAQTGEIFAIEKDRRLFEFLEQRFASAPNLALQHDDALKFLQRGPRDWSDWKLVANLPYSVASPILIELAQATVCPERMVVTVQREVAQRIVANPGDEDYGLLTLLIQLCYEPRDWFKVPAGCFFPQPDVDSACLTLIRRSKPLLDRQQSVAFTTIVRLAFSQRRKMMFKLLRKDWATGRLTAAFEYLQLPLTVRAEQVSVDTFVGLTKALTAG
jgi:16S rRNA (adenine1518-N6/adenine1519-N6)-dimethyltransferase